MEKKLAAEKTGSPLTMSIRDGVAVVAFDEPDKKVNTLNSKLISYFEQFMGEIQNNPDVKGLVLISRKKDCFVAGADINELLATQDAKQASELSRKGQLLFNRLASSPKPVVAAISGSCLGGGLELALACHYRIATATPSTVLGLPEVMLGLLPGAGGTQRLPRLIGLEKALTLMLTGATVPAQRALRLGIVDYLSYSENIEDLAVSAVHRLAAKTLVRKVKKNNSLTGVLEQSSLGKGFILKKAKEGVMDKTKGLYPAPLAIIDVVGFGLSHTVEEGLKKEAEAFGQLSQTPEAKGLMSLYFATTELKKNRFGKPKKAVTDVTVLGSGLMGAGIAAVSIQKGYSVRMKDLNFEALGKGKKQVWKELESKVKKKNLTAFQREQILSRLALQVDYHQVEKTDLVIEAVFEDLDLKHRILREVEEKVPANVVFATNTSALPIADIAKFAKHPERVLGMHYFSPVPKMPLLEIITTDKTSNEATSVAVEVGLKQGKTVIVVKDGPGFYTTRILAPYMDEAAIVLLEGVSIPKLDDAMLHFGFPVGPIKLIDEIGVDVASHVGTSIGQALGKRIASQDPALLSGFLAQKWLGRKTGKGFYVYEAPTKGPLSSLLGQKPSRVMNPGALALLEKHRKKAGKDIDDVSILQKRLAYRMISEAVYCLQDGILSSAMEGDIGAVFGVGFPPFLGGPFRYLNTKGLQKVCDELKRFADIYGERFEPCSLLQDMAREGKMF